MTLEDAVQVERDYFKSNSEFIDNVKKLKDDKTKIDGILMYINSLNNVLESKVETTFAQNEMLKSINESLQGLGSYVKELTERISALEKNREQI